MKDYDEIISFDFVDGKIVVVKRKYSNLIFACDPPRKCPDDVWRETYAVVGAEIKLVNTEIGNHSPPHQIGESISFSGES